MNPTNEQTVTGLLAENARLRELNRDALLTMCAMVRTVGGRIDVPLREFREVNVDMLTRIEHTARDVIVFQTVKI